MPDWIDELAALRTELGATRLMRIRWEYRTIHDGSATGLQVFLNAGRRDRVLATLYEEAAKPGARPVIEVELEPTPAIDAVEQGSLVAVAGEPKAGHAVAIVLGSEVLWPTYPATLRLRSRRL